MVWQRRASVCLALAMLIISLFPACGSPTAGSSNSSSSSSTVLSVVAAENFYGNIIKQLGGSHVSVTSILSDPNVDPHEYESNVQNGIAIQKAQFVIENGLGYDDWIDNLLSASAKRGGRVGGGGGVGGEGVGGDAHVWYGFDNTATIAQAITDTL